MRRCVTRRVELRFALIPPLHLTRCVCISVCVSRTTLSSICLSGSPLSPEPEIAAVGPRVFISVLLPGWVAGSRWRRRGQAVRLCCQVLGATGDLLINGRCGWHGTDTAHGTERNGQWDTTACHGMLTEHGTAQPERSTAYHSTSWGITAQPGHNTKGGTDGRTVCARRHMVRQTGSSPVTTILV